MPTCPRPAGRGSGGRETLDIAAGLGVWRCRAVGALFGPRHRPPVPKRLFSPGGTLV